VRGVLELVKNRANALLVAAALRNLEQLHRQA